MNWLKNSAYYLINKKKSISVSFCILLNFLADSQLSILSIAKFNLCMPCKLDCCLHQNFTTISWDPILSSTPPLKLILHRSLSKSSKNLRCNSVTGDMMCTCTQLIIIRYQRGQMRLCLIMTSMVQFMIIRSCLAAVFQVTKNPTHQLLIMTGMDTIS